LYLARRRRFENELAEELKQHQRLKEQDLGRRGLAPAEAARSAVPMLLVLLAGCAAEAIQDPIPDVPLSQQRAVTRSDFDWRWPFSVGVGTLGCQSGAVVFRHAGANYALNEEATARGYGSVQSIRMPESSRPPSNPLSRLKQEQRMEIFAASARCNTESCRRQLQETHRVSAAELKQIEDEGHERTWAPLPRKPKDLGPLVEAGLKLCQG
jgi:hypothetical protein